MIGFSIPKSNRDLCAISHNTLEQSMYEILISFSIATESSLSINFYRPLV